MIPLTQVLYIKGENNDNWRKSHTISISTAMKATQDNINMAKHNIVCHVITV